MKRTASDPIDAELRAELGAIAAERGLQLAHVEFTGSLLRLILDRPDGGVSLADCEAVSKEASALLDVVDFGPGHYTLEVSSPGLDRQLFGARDYQRFAGRAVRVTFKPPEPGATKRTVVGRLEAYRPDAGGEIDVTDERGRTSSIRLEDILAARLKIEL